MGGGEGLGVGRPRGSQIVGRRWVGKRKLLYSMVIRVVKFSGGGTKLEIFLPKDQHTQRKLLNFESWYSG